MKKGKATGMDGIPVDVCKCLGEGIDMVWDLIQTIYKQEKIPMEAAQMAADKEAFGLSRVHMY